MKNAHCRKAKLLLYFVCTVILATFLPCPAISYENLSQPIYEVTIDYGVNVPMRDGRNLAANIARPNVAGQFSALVVLSPYGKNVSSDTPDGNFFAPRGYVVVYAELRGTGRSQGIMTDYFIDQQWQDGYDLVEWVAQQSWCNGNVGMGGTSWMAITTTRTAAKKPPHLKAIAINSAYANFYGDHFFPGGTRGLSPWTWHHMGNQLYTFLRGPVYDILGSAGQEVDTALWEFHIANNGWTTCPQGLWENSVYNDFWKDKDLRSKYNTLDTPTLQIANHFDHVRNIDEAYQNHMVLKDKNIPHKLVVGPWSHGAYGTTYLIDQNTLYLAWFDYWLKGLDTGIMKEPPIALFVMRDNKWRFENEWPIARTKYTKFYFTPEGDLTTNKGKVQSQASKTKTKSLTYDYKPWVGIAAGPQTPFLDFNYTDFLVQDDHREDDALSLTFTSDVLTEDFEVSGMPEVMFYASSNASDTNWVVKLNELQPDGTSVMITRGWLNSSYRESNVNPRLPQDWKFVTPTNINQGAVYRYKFTLANTSYVFKAGKRIRIAISSSDWPTIWPNPNQAENTIHLIHKDKALGKGKLFSHITLPVVPKPKKSLPEPQLPSSPDVPWVPPSSYGSRYWVDDDIFGDTITVNSAYDTGSYPDGLGNTRSYNELWQVMLPKERPQDHRVVYNSIGIINREVVDSIKYTYSYTVDQNGPVVDFQTEYGGPFSLPSTP
jgi:hypothetical protein